VAFWHTVYTYLLTYLLTQDKQRLTDYILSAVDFVFKCIFICAKSLNFIIQENLFEQFFHEFYYSEY